MFQFEKAATVGVLVVVILMAIIIYKAVTLGFPAITSGELPIFSLKVDSRSHPHWRALYPQFLGGL
jgi:hypothetical protein